SAREWDNGQPRHLAIEAFAPRQLISIRRTAYFAGSSDKRGFWFPCHSQQKKRPPRLIATASKKAANQILGGEFRHWHLPEHLPQRTGCQRDVGHLLDRHQMAQPELRIAGLLAPDQPRGFNPKRLQVL